MGRTVRGGRCSCSIVYGALPSQARFHTSKARFKGFSGPIGSGKSQALCQEAIKLSYLNPGRLGLVGAPTYSMLRDTTQTALLEILEENGIPYVLRKSESVLIIKDTGSRILLRSTEEYERLRGTNLAWFGVDELTYVQEPAWLRLEGRLRDPKAGRLSGFAVWTPKGRDWVHRRFVECPVEGYEVIMAKPMENRYVLEKIPDFYERLKQSYDEKFYQQEALGEYVRTGEGLVYHAFDRAVNVKALKVDDRLPLLWAFDFNVDPMCSLVVQIDSGVIHVLDEIVLSRSSTWEACQEFLNRYPAHHRGVVIYGDASGNAHKTTGSADFKIVKDFLAGTRYRTGRFEVPGVNPAVRDRVALVNGKLKNAAGVVSLYVDPRCQELIHDFEEVSYKAGSGVIDKSRDSRRTHLSDALGYLVWEEFKRRPSAGERMEGVLFPH